MWIMSLAMTPAEREAFLAEVHVAVVTVADDGGRGPLATPQRWELARRYLGREGADGYIEATRDVTDRMCAIHVRPAHWLTRDYTKAGG